VDGASKTSSDVLDAELDTIKAEADRHELKVARRLAERFEERHGDKVTRRQRWRLRTLQANTWLGEGEFERAGRLLLEAKCYQPEEEKARINEALGLELTGEEEKAHALAVTLRHSFPDSADAAAVWVRTAPATVRSDELEAEVGKFASKASVVAVALAICSLNRGDVGRAERHALKATELEPEMPQGWLLLGQCVHSRGYAEVRVEEGHKLFRQAEAHYSRAIDLARRGGNVGLEAMAHLNRGLVRGLLEESAAGDDFKAARQLLPADADVMRKYAVFLSDRGDLDRAVEQATAAVEAVPGGQSSALLAALRWDRNRGDDRQQALDLCLALVRGLVTDRFDEALEMALLGLAESERWPEAEELLAGLPAGKISEVARNTLLGQLRLAQGERDKAAELARAAHTAVGTATSAADIRRLARLLGRLELYSLALPLLQRVAQPGRFDPDTRMLLDCANSLHDHAVILRVCRELREAGVRDRRLLDNEIDILQLHDRPAAIEVLRQHLVRCPDDRLAKLRLSVLGLQAEHPELVDTDPEHLPPVEEAAPGTVGHLVLALLSRTGRWHDAYRYAYGLLRRNLSDPLAHLHYCNIIIQGEQEGFRLAASDTVRPGVAVAYREAGDSHEQWLVIEEDERELLEDEVSPNHPRVERMLGKKVGETFVLSSSGIQERSAEVVAIQNKYVYRLQECMRLFQDHFPERADLQLVRLAREGDGDEEHLDLTPIFASLDRRRRQVTEALTIYRTQPTPVHLLAQGVGRDIFQALDYLTGTPDIGVRWCCAGQASERVDALRALGEARALVLDTTALYTACRLDLFDVLRRWGRSLAISQTTFDKVRDIVDEATAPGTQRHMTTDERGRYVFVEASEESRRPYIEAHRRLGEFVREACTVVAVPEVVELAPERREQWAQLFDRDGLESSVLAARDGHVLWSNDMTLRAIAQTDFGATRSAWTQAVLQAAVTDGALDEAEFNRLSARLIGFGYSFTWCNPEIVMQAGALADWTCEAPPLREVIRHFGAAGVLPQARLLLAAHSIVVIGVETEHAIGTELENTRAEGRCVTCPSWATPSCLSSAP
jgi:tetratricopeptide (TPR) repeat protein